MSMHESVSQELAALKAGQAKASAERLVKAAQDAGKLTPAMTAWGTSYATENPEGFKAWMETAPDLRPGGGKDSGHVRRAAGQGRSVPGTKRKRPCARPLA